jgi:hypothetical protein
MAFGWSIIVYELPERRLRKHMFERLPRGKKLTLWEAGLGGLDWLDSLVEAGDAHLVDKKMGYPDTYQCRTADLPNPLPDASQDWVIVEAWDKG